MISKVEGRHEHSLSALAQVPTQGVRSGHKPTASYMSDMSAIWALVFFILIFLNVFVLDRFFKKKADR
jgi:hypothetical protein